MIRLYSTLQRARVALEPRTDGEIGFYVCGPTVQSPPHIGHGRSAVVFDVIRRYLIWSGYRVTFVRNITDIEDKIIAKAAETGEDVATYATRMAAEFADGYHRLGVLDPDIEPLATDHIAEMHELIATLIAKGKAYQAGDDVYFSVRSDEDYGKLSNQNLDEMRSGTRIEPNDVKHDPLDFALWKGAKPGEPNWDSPWGAGRPGWHIECSAMAARYLGNDFDIHSGGTDLIFPHHENEIAQSESATGERFARYWLHNGMVNLGGAKMAKSTGNVVDLSTALDKYGGMALRLLFLRAHYRAPIEYSEALAEEGAEAYRRIERLLERAPESPASPDEEVIEAFRAAMDDDFATPAAVGILFDAVREANRALDEGEEAGAKMAAVRQLVAVLGLDEPDLQTTGLDREALGGVAAHYGADGSGDAESIIERLLAIRASARADRDFARADAIRDQLAEVGVTVEDTPDGARWVRG